MGAPPVRRFAPGALWGHRVVATDL